MTKHKKFFKQLKKSLKEAIQISKDMQDPEKLKQLKQQGIVTVINNNSKKVGESTND